MSLQCFVVCACHRASSHFSWHAGLLHSLNIYLIKALPQSHNANNKLAHLGNKKLHVN